MQLSSVQLPAPAVRSDPACKVCISVKRTSRREAALPVRMPKVGARHDAAKVSKVRFYPAKESIRLNSLNSLNSLTTGRRPAGALVLGPGVIAGKRVASIASIANAHAGYEQLVSWCPGLRGLRSVQLREGS